MSLGRKSALRNAFALIIGLLALATLLSYSIQESFSRRSVEIHRQFVQEQEVLTSIRRNLWMGGILTRDYFLNSSPTRTEEFRAQLDKLKAETSRLLPLLVATGATPESVQQLRERFDDLWLTLETSVAPDFGQAQPYDFIQREVVPRRDAAGQVLRQVERANRDALSEIESRFTLSRTAAATSLMYLLGACLIAGALVAVLSLRYSRHLERQSAERFAEVSEAKQQLERLSARLMDVQEEERTKLSRELHDEIVQNLAVIKLELNRAVSHSQGMQAEFRTQLIAARDLAESTMRSVRDISMLLRPSLLDDLGLFPALQAQAEEFSRRTGTRCKVEERGISADLPSPVKTCVYRVVQEALRNCEKHSQATEVSISIVQLENEIEAEVLDNGIGFDPADEQRRSPFHLGLLGMRERASALGGSLVLESAPQRGTSVQLRIPLAPKSSHSPKLEAFA